MLLAVGVELPERAAGAEPGVVDQQVDRPARVGQAGLDRPQAGVGLEVGDEHLAGTAVVALELGGEVGQGGLAAGDEDQVLAPLGERDGERPPDARRRAGDEGTGVLHRVEPRDRGAPRRRARWTGPRSEPDRVGHLGRVDVDRGAEVDLGHGPLRVLEAVAGERAHHLVGRRRRARRAAAWSSPATDAADAGSTNTP